MSSQAERTADEAIMCALEDYQHAVEVCDTCLVELTQRLAVRMALPRQRDHSPGE